MRIDPTAWEVPAIFRMIVEGAGIDRDEANRAFNMGVGMVLIVPTEHEAEVRAHLAAQNEPVFDLGRTVTGTGIVRWSDR